MIHFSLAKLGTGTIVGGFIALSLVSTGVAASKLWESVKTTAPKAEALEVEQQPESEATINPSPTPKPSPSGCVITLFGQQYDVTKLRTTHSGGDIFACGTDMTQSYTKQHGTNVSRMRPYLINSGKTSTASSSATFYPNDDHDETESDEEETRYIEHQDQDQNAR